jgi:branched-chain amino acid transport system permease protein
MTILVAGLSTGALYAIVALACNIIFIASRVFNFAQAYILMLCTFVAFSLGNVLGWPFWLTVLGCAVVGAVAGGLEEVVAIRWLAKRPGSHSELVTTLGYGLTIGGLVVLLWGTQPKALGYWSSEPVINYLGGRFVPSDIYLIVFALVLAFVISAFMQKTTVGLASLATAEDRSAAMLRGVSVTLLALGAFAVAGAIVGAVAPLIAAKTYAVSTLANALAVKSFIVLAIGGMGSQLGAIVGGFVLGMVEILAATMLGSEWRNVAAFVLLLVVLLVLPRGLFAKRSLRVV